MSTSWNNPSRPTGTSYNQRIKPGDYTYYTWGNAPDTWGSANQTWGTYGTGMPPVSWSERSTVSTIYSSRIIP